MLAYLHVQQRKRDAVPSLCEKCAATKRLLLELGLFARGSQWAGEGIRAVMGVVAAALLALVAVAAPTKVASQTSVTCVWDLNSDGIVTTNDLLYLLAVFGDVVVHNGNAASADFNGDGVISTIDLLELLAVFGRMCEDLANPPPPPVTPEVAAAEFEAALAAVFGDPAASLVGIFSAMSFQGDVSMVAEGQARDDFEESFTTNMASSIGDGM